MISRWISEVPSKIVKILASRCQRSTGYSRVYPFPPRTWMACSVRIRAREVRVIGDEGEQIGVMPPFEALKLARERNLDKTLVDTVLRPPI